MTGVDSWACTNVIASGYALTMFHPTYDDARAAFAACLQMQAALSTRGRSFHPRPVGRRA